MNTDFRYWIPPTLMVLAVLAGCSGQPIRPNQTKPLAAHKPHAVEPAPVTLPWPGNADRRTTDDVLAAYSPYVSYQLKPYFQQAGIPFPPRALTLVAYKAEKRLEVWARGDGDFKLVRDYPILAASGGPGPKLRQGDKQVPEGIYAIEGLNPNSRFHLSMKLNYPNEFDLMHAAEEGRDNPGSDIFIHGKDLSIGCLAIGDAAIEELFVLVAQTGRENVKVIIAPHSNALGELDAGQVDGPDWLGDLYEQIQAELSSLDRPVKAASANRSNTGYH